MSGPSLYDRLLGQIGRVPFDAYDDRTLECLRIQQNVQRISNTRTGALEHLPDYGLPALPNIYKALPAFGHVLKQQMEATLLKYEPRIRAIDVEILENHDPGDPGELRNDVPSEEGRAHALRYVFRAIRSDARETANFRPRLRRVDVHSNARVLPHNSEYLQSTKDTMTDSKSAASQAFATSAALILLLCGGIAHAEYREQWLSTGKSQHTTRHQTPTASKPQPNSSQLASTRLADTGTQGAARVPHKEPLAESDPIAEFVASRGLTGAELSHRKTSRRSPS